jgi:two-component system sensor histidine kinase QseC
MKNPTLTRKLFLRIAPTILVTIAAIGLLAYWSAKREIDQVYDAQLINNANVLWILEQDELKEGGADTPKKIEDIDFNLNNQRALNEDADDYAEARMFRIWKSGTIMMFSSTAPPESVAQRAPGFSQIEYKNEEWRIYTLAIPKTSISIEVGEKKSLRDSLVGDIVLNLAYPLAILVPVIGFLIWLGIGSGIGTVRTLVRQIRHRSPEDLSSISVEDLPRDLSPLGQSINQLLSKLDQSLTAERRFSDHAAHQLRTPLAGLKLQLQMLAKADSESERRALIGDLTRSTDRATHLVEQLLRAARVSHQPVNLKAVPLYHATASVIAEMASIADEKHLEISLEGHEEANVRADELLTKLMISNLMDNAIKYTPDSGKININVLPQDGMWCLSMSDTGPGISESDREAVFHRFYRADNAVGDGAGLGLAIVGDIIDRMSGGIALKTPQSGQGLRVEVLLPKA